MSYTTGTLVLYGDPDAKPGARTLGILLVLSADIATPGAWRKESKWRQYPGASGSRGAPSDIVNDDGCCSSDGDTQDGLCIDGTYICIRRDTDTIETMCTRSCD